MDNVWSSGLKRTILRRLIDSLVITKIIGMLNMLKKMLSSLLDKSTKIFQSLFEQKYISGKELTYFIYDNKNATKLGKLYLVV